MKILTGILVVVIIALVVGCATPSSTTPSPSYEVVSTYTDEVILGWQPIPGTHGGASGEFYSRACIEIKNTGSTAGLFSVNFLFSEEYSGRDLIYLESGETGVASYIPLQTVDDWHNNGLNEFANKTAKWDYDVTAITLEPKS